MVFILWYTVPIIRIQSIHGVYTGPSPSLYRAYTDPTRPYKDPIPTLHDPIRTLYQPYSDPAPTLYRPYTILSGPYTARYGLHTDFIPKLWCAMGPVRRFPCSSPPGPALMRI